MKRFLTKYQRFIVITSLVLTLVGGQLVGAIQAFAATTADVTITATPEYLAMTNDSGNWTIGLIAEATTVYFTADDLVPAEPLVNGDMKGTLTNTGSVTSDIAIHGHAFTGGAGWTLSADNTPAADEVAIRAGIAGMANRAAMIQVITTDTDLKTSLAAAGTIMWCMELLTGTFSDGVAKTGTVTLTISKS
jgi:hypothetical protein